MNLCGVTVDQYEIGELIGRGGMGEVYKARDTKLERVVAIKSPRSDRKDRVGSADRLVREAKKACRVAHPHIAAVHDVIVYGEQPLIVMEYVEGKDLASLLKGT